MGISPLGTIPMEIFEHFSCYSKLPVRLDHVRDQILATGAVSKIIRIPVEITDYIIYGGFNSYRDLTSYASNSGDAIVAQIGYPKDMSEDWQRMIIVKEMLHALDPIEATSSTIDKVNRLMDDLIDAETKEAIGLPAHFDHNGMFHALCILMPRDVVDALRPLNKQDPERYSIAKIAAEARIPETFVKFALTDEWVKVLDAL